MRFKIIGLLMSLAMLSTNVWAGAYNPKLSYKMVYKHHEVAQESISAYMDGCILHICQHGSCDSKDHFIPKQDVHHITLADGAKLKAIYAFNNSCPNETAKSSDPEYATFVAGNVRSNFITSPVFGLLYHGQDGKEYYLPQVEFVKQ